MIALRTTTQQHFLLLTGDQRGEDGSHIVAASRAMEQRQLGHGPLQGGGGPSAENSRGRLRGARGTCRRLRKPLLKKTFFRRTTGSFLNQNVSRSIHQNLGPQTRLRLELAIFDSRARKGFLGMAGNCLQIAYLLSHTCNMEIPTIFEVRTT